MVSLTEYNNEISKQGGAFNHGTSTLFFSRIIQKQSRKNRNLSAILFHGSYMYEDRLLPVQEWWLSDRLYILKDKPTVFGNPDYQLELPDKRTDQQRCVKLE